MRPGDRRDAAAAGVVVRVRRGGEDGASGGRAAVGARSRVGAGQGVARRPARADPPLRGVQGADRGRRPRGARGSGRCSTSGHSVGHAIEAATGYKAFSHGEAVAVGLLAALWLSAQCAGLDAAVEEEVRELLRRQGLPVVARNVSPAAVIDRWPTTRRPARGGSASRSSRTVGRPVWGIDPGDELVEKAVARAVRRPLGREPDGDAHDVRRPAASGGRVGDDDRPVLGRSPRGRRSRRANGRGSRCRSSPVKDFRAIRWPPAFRTLTTMAASNTSDVPVTRTVAASGRRSRGVDDDRRQEAREVARRHLDPARDARRSR